jgi:hypothetical protein
MFNDSSAQVIGDTSIEDGIVLIGQAIDIIFIWVRHDHNDKSKSQGLDRLVSYWATEIAT